MKGIRKLLNTQQKILFWVYRQGTSTKRWVFLMEETISKFVFFEKEKI